MGIFSASSVSTLFLVLTICVDGSGESCGLKCFARTYISFILSICDVYHLTWGWMLSDNGISLVDAIFWTRSDGIHLLALGIGDSVAGALFIFVNIVLFFPDEPSLCIWLPEATWFLSNSKKGCIANFCLEIFSKVLLGGQLDFFNTQRR